MANIKKAENDKKGKSMTLKLTSEQRRMIEKGAKENHMSMSSFVVAKATQKGSLQACKEYNRICKLVHTEEALGVLRERIKVKNPDTDILEAINNLEQEIINLWRC